MTRGVAQASRKWVWCEAPSVFGVFSGVELGNVADLGVEEGLGRRCQSVDLAHDPR